MYLVLPPLHTRGAVHRERVRVGDARGHSALTPVWYEGRGRVVEEPRQKDTARCLFASIASLEGTS